LAVCGTHCGHRVTNASNSSSVDCVHFHFNFKTDSKLKDRIELLALGKIPALETKRPGVKEVSQISIAIDRLIFGYQQTANFADKIGSGYFTASFEVLSKHDVIGSSLIQMRDKVEGIIGRAN